MPKISIIIPVYNAEKYIKRCLDSIINQTEKQDIEIIIINDGSTDNSEQAIKQYIENIENTETGYQIRYYSKENSGAPETRNFGIEKAQGEYILFVDSDDYIDSQLIEKLNKYIEENIDLIKFKMQKVDQNGNILEKIDGPSFEKTSGEEAFEKLYGDDILIDSPCIYLIKKELFQNMRFKRRYHEDFGLIPLLIIKADTFVSTPYFLYTYVQAPNSITRNEDYKKTIEKMEDCLAHYDNMLQEIEKINPSKKAKENIKIYYTNAVILKLQELNNEDRKHYIKEIKARKMYKNIKIRNFKQLIKNIILRIDVNLYLKIR